MGDTGFNWGAWQAMQKSAGDWTADAIADNGTETGDATSLDGIAACEVGVGALENTGAINGPVTVFILGTADGTNYEETTIGKPWTFQFTPTASDTTYFRFNVPPNEFGTFKIAFFNESGQSLAFTVKFRTATIPVATA